MTSLIDLRKIVENRNYAESEFLQAIDNMFISLDVFLKKNPSFLQNGILERIVEPERQIMFRVPWVDDCGVTHVNRGYRVQFNSALGPYKGGLRFHPTVNLSIMKFLAFEQTFKNALTGITLGGAKGGSDFNPCGKSDHEIMNFCQSFMNELYRHIGPNTDIPAGDIGVGAKEIGYLFGQYKKIKNDFTGAMTGKSLTWGGALGRKEATGYGLCYFLDIMLQDHNINLKGKKIIISGSGNVAIYAAEKAIELGAVVVAMSDSKGSIYCDNGINLDHIKEIKFMNKEPIHTYISYDKNTLYQENPHSIWSFPCDIALACATQNEIDKEDAMQLIKNHVIAVCEGANMPCTPEAIVAFKKHHVLFAPGKASNAGGVAVSGIEMSQNATFIPWDFDVVDQKLKRIMEDIYMNVKNTAMLYGHPDDFELGANIAGFIKVATAMMEQGNI